MDINTLSLTPASTEELAPDLFAHEQAIATAEARMHVRIDLLIAGALLVAVQGVGVPDRRAVVFQAFLGIGILTAYDLYWWLWLRKAEPSDAYRRLQARPVNTDVQRVIAYTMVAISCLPFLILLLFAPRP